MASLLERRLLVICGKGGVGKTTVAAAIGLLAASRGLRAIVVEVGDQAQLPALFGLARAQPGVETKLQDHLWSVSIDPERALLEWLQALGGRVPGRVLASSGTFQYFAAAAPGAKELVSMVKIWELTQSERWRKRAAGYHLVVLDAPATGHALALLNSPRTFGAIARVGPIAAQAQRVRELLSDPDRSGYLAVAQATEMAITETLEFQDGLRRALDRGLHAVILNAILPRRFTSSELRRIADLERRPGAADAEADDRGPGEGRAAGVDVRARHASAAERRRETDAALVARSAARAARAAAERARFQRNQRARLRRRGLEVLGVPFVFGRELDLAAVRRIGEHLGRRL
jgi:anion-transporting  ArsA/GET3 family ATPase